MTRRVNALVLVMIMAIAPLVPMASADPTIGLSTDVSHVILSPGEATNITLTIDNNGSTIESYTIYLFQVSITYGRLYQPIQTSAT